MRGRPATGSMMPHQLRRPQDAVEIAEARREIGDRAPCDPSFGRQQGDHGGGVALIVRAAVRPAAPAATSQKPFSSSPAIRRQNTGSLSKRGKHHHTMLAMRSTSAAMRPLPMTARSRGWARSCCTAPFGQLRQPLAHRARRAELMIHAGEGSAHRKAVTAQFAAECETRPCRWCRRRRKDRHATRERRLAHQGAHGPRPCRRPTALRRSPTCRAG